MVNGINLNDSILKLNDKTLTVDEKIGVIGTTLVQQDEILKQVQNDNVNLNTKYKELEKQVADINSKMYINRFEELWNFYQNFNLDKIALDASGNLTLANGIVAGAMAIKNNPENKTIGEAYICPSGKIFDETSENCIASDDLNNDGTFVEVKTTAVTDSAKIFITPENDLGSVWVEKSADNSGFKIKIKPESPITEKAKVNWWIVEEKR